MKLTILSRNLGAFCVGLLLLSSTAFGQAIERIEPPFWWVGMQSPALQLLVHGPNVAALQLQIHYPGVRVIKQHRTSNANYLFVDLQLDGTTQPGQIELEFVKTDTQAVVLRQRYTLHQRKPESSQRQGFGPKDAIYLVVPDRFANGNPHNDSISTLSERTNRAAPSGRHGGDIEGLRQHLRYIAGLGFTQIWPTPLTENNALQYSYHGYASTDFYQVDARLGSNASYAAMVQEAKQIGLGVIQDIVLNHIGQGHWWMQDLPSPDWLNQWPQYTQTQHAHISIPDPHAAQADRQQYTDGWFVPEMPDLNQRNPLLANYLMQMSIWWVEYADLSGIRMDTHSYSDKAFLAQWSERLVSEYPKLSIVGEEWSPLPAVVAYWQKGKKNHDGYLAATPSLIDFPLHGAMLDALNDTNPGHSGLMKLYEALAQDFVYADASKLVLMDGNHDTSRLFSLLNEDLALYKMALIYLATTQRIPQFFYGTELLLTSPKQRDDGIVRADFPGGWPSDPVNAFTGKGLSTEQMHAQQFVRQLFNWRKTAMAVHEGHLLHYVPSEGSYVYFRLSPQQKLMIVMNKNTQAIQLDTKRFAQVLPIGATVRNVLDGSTAAVAVGLRVAARSAVIFEIED